MLKFMRNEDEFDREIQKRQPLKGGRDSDGKCCVMTILKHFHLEGTELSQFKQVRLSSDSELRYLIVMPLGVEDLSDEIRSSIVTTPPARNS